MADRPAWRPIDRAQARNLGRFDADHEDEDPARGSGTPRGICHPSPGGKRFGGFCASPCDVAHLIDTGDLEYMGEGRGAYVKETTYRYVGPGNGGHNGAEALQAQSGSAGCSCNTGMCMRAVAIFIIATLVGVIVWVLCDRTTADELQGAWSTMPRETSECSGCDDHRLLHGAGDAQEESTTQADCMAREWSPSKLEWCCHHRRRGCGLSHAS